MKSVWSKSHLLAIWIPWPRHRPSDRAYSALSSAEKVSFHIANRKTGNRVERRFVDSETEKPVERDEQVGG